VYNDRETSDFFNSKFDLLAALTFPDADCMHLETGLMFHIWAFSVRKLFVILVVLSAHILNFRPMILPMKATCGQNLTQ
jgi:hypothetical protein